MTKLSLGVLSTDLIISRLFFMDRAQDRAVTVILWITTFIQPAGFLLNVTSYRKYVSCVKWKPLILARINVDLVALIKKM